MNTSPPTKSGFETAFSGVGRGVYRVLAFILGALIGCAFFFGPTIQQYSDFVRSVYAVPHKGAK
jgi:hypothetical protein